MRERTSSGYLDRLLDQVSGRRTRDAAQPPRRLPWGATRPAGAGSDDEKLPTPPVARPATAPPRRADPPQPQRIRRAAEAPPRRGVPTATTAEPRLPQRPARTTVREVVREQVSRAEPEPGPPTARVVRERTERIRETVRRVEREPRGSAPTPVSPQLPDAVTRAMQRLGALSIHVPPPAEPVTVPPPPPPPPMPTGASRTVAAPERVPERQAAVLVAPRPVPAEQPSRPPQVHIGSIEVTVAAPPAPPAAPPPAPRAAAAPPAPVTRLSRPTDRYGFGQG